MEPNYQAQQDKWLLQERLRQIRALEEEVARLKWRNYNLDAQLTQTFDILDSQADITRTFSGALPPVPPSRNFTPMTRQPTPREMLEELRVKPSAARMVPSEPRSQRQGQIQPRREPIRQTGLTLPLVQDFSVPSGQELQTAGSKGSLQANSRSQFQQGLQGRSASVRSAESQPGRRSQESPKQRSGPLALTLVPKLDISATDKADLPHH